MCSFLADLNSVVVDRDSSNTLCLIVTIIEVRRDGPAEAPPVPVFTLKCVFDDHVRCLTACQVCVCVYVRELPCGAEKSLVLFLSFPSTVH